MSKKEPVKYVSPQAFRASVAENRGSFLNDKGELILPKIMPNCFGLVALVEIPAEEVANGQKDIADGYDAKHGDTYELWLGGIRNKPYKVRKKTTTKEYNSELDTLRDIVNGGNCPYIFNDEIGRDVANPVRIEALKDYYAKQMKTEENSGNDYYDGNEREINGEIVDDSPFDVSLVDSIINNRSLLAVVLKATEKSDMQ